jgi:sulfide:quinone oxidoreductase
MKNLAIIGAGTAGTTLANRMRRQLPADWALSVIDPQPLHLYQPGLLYLPFGKKNEAKLSRPHQKTLASEIQLISEEVSAIDPDRKEIRLAGRDSLPYDLLVVASGSQIHPEETPGLTGPHWGRDVFDFYTLEGSLALRQALAGFSGGRIVVNVVEMPIKCPVAPLEFLFLADAYFTKRGIRDRVELVYATPLDGAFTRPVASAVLSSLLEEKGIVVETDFSAAEVDGSRRLVRSYDEREVPYDLLVSVPTHTGAPFIEASGLGNELGFVPTDPKTLRVKDHDSIYAIGDATDLPSSKAGSVAHFQSEVLAENLLASTTGGSPPAEFDGHANCFVETGFGKALLIDFNYDVEPLPGRYPLASMGPFSLLKESRTNHMGKLAFRWLYWNRLLPGKSLFVSNGLSMKGKQQPAEALSSA